MQTVIDLLDVAAKEYPIKAIAPEMGKSESTLRNELTQQEGYKLGLITAYQILKITGNLRALDRIEHLLGRVAFPIPIAKSKDMPAVMQMVSKISKEFGDHMHTMATAMEDGIITRQEAIECRKELEDVIAASAELKTYLEHIIDAPTKLENWRKSNVK